MVMFNTQSIDFDHAIRGRWVFRDRAAPASSAAPPRHLRWLLLLAPTHSMLIYKP